MEVYSATGRRKAAIARVRIYPGTGEVKVNKRSLLDYFMRESLQSLILRPIEHIDQANKFDVIATVHGGGISGQAGALQLGIARAFSQIDEEIRVLLRKANFLTRDARVVERKKYGQPGARKKYQYSKR